MIVKKAFTLIELIVVIAIIAILALILVPQVTGYIYNANNSVDVSNLRTLNNITHTYAVIENKTDNVFEDIETDSERMSVLVDNNYLSEPLQTKNEENSFLWCEVYTM